MAGPIEVATPSGKVYILIFVDDFSRRLFICLLRNKNEFFREFQHLDNQIEVETTNRVAFLRSDSDGVFVSNELNEYCRKRGIQRQFSTAYNQFQNGVSERAIRTLVEMMRTMLIHAGAPRGMWGETACYAAQIMNRKPTKAVPNFPNPISAWRGHNYEQAHESLRVWGCKVFYFDFNPKVKKLDPKAREGILVGLDTEKKAWRIYVDNQVVCRRDVTFIEDIFPFKKQNPHLGENFTLKIGDEFLSKQVRDLPSEGDIMLRDPLSNNIDPHVLDEVKISSEKNEVRRSNRQWKPTADILESFAYSNELYQKKAEISIVGEPETVPNFFEEAMQSNDKALWLVAISSEILSHLSNQTLQPCELPEGRKAIPLAWVFKIKMNPDGSKRYKARIVMKGFQQREGVDFGDTYAPVAKWTSIRIILAITTILNWDLFHVDFETAFMIPKMDAEVYVRTIAGMQELTPEGNIARMLKGVNGCKQGSKLFYEEVKNTLIENGFKMSIFDSCVFTKHVGNVICVVITWVDDLLISTNCDKILKQLLQNLKTKYKYKLVIEPTLFLGMKLSRD